MRRIHQTFLSSLVTASLLTFSLFSFADGPITNPEKEKELLAVLQSEAPTGDKAIACKQLAIYGSGASAAELAKLLPNPELSSWSRIALEAIPGPEADEALRKATETLEGKVLVGVINSIGVRRDANSVAPLTARLQDKDIEVASAAAVALGRIGNAEATDSLRKSFATAIGPVKSSVAEGLVLCAERFWAAGVAKTAIELYDEVRAADVPEQRKIEATRGAILARGDEGIPLLTEMLHSQEKGMYHVALAAAREFPGSEIDKALAAQLTKASPGRAVLIIGAMADRKDTVVLPAILKEAQSGAEPVRVAAVNALAQVGDASCLDTLLKIASEEKGEMAQAARAALAELPGDKVDSQIVTMLDTAKGGAQAMLLDLVGKRRVEAVPSLRKALTSNDKLVRTAAFGAMGETVSLKDLNLLISQVVTPQHSEDAEVAQQALKAASIRMPDREACAAELTVAIEKAKSTPTKSVILQILGEMGGPKALATIGAAAKGTDAQLQDVSSQLLGKWSTEDAAPVLLDLATTNSNPYKIRALRGYIRIANQFVLPEAQRMEMCQKAFDASRQIAEKKLVLEILKRYATVDGLKIAIKAMKVAELKDDATFATLTIAQKLGVKGVDVKEQLANANIEKMKIEIVKAEYGAGATQKDVTEVIQKKVGDLPIITLDSGIYNANFGGDPVPGSVKQLKVKYKINGKAGEATFAENSPIFLPMPK